MATHDGTTYDVKSNKFPDQRDLQRHLVLGGLHRDNTCIPPPATPPPRHPGKQWTAHLESQNNRKEPLLLFLDENQRFLDGGYMYEAS